MGAVTKAVDACARAFSYKTVSDRTNGTQRPLCIGKFFALLVILYAVAVQFVLVFFSANTAAVRVRLLRLTRDHAM